MNYYFRKNHAWFREIDGKKIITFFIKYVLFFKKHLELYIFYSLYVILYNEITLFFNNYISF